MPNIYLLRLLIHLLIPLKHSLIPTYHTLLNPTKVSDWFPTMIDMATIKYTPRAGYELDGVSQFKAWATTTVLTPPRTQMVYNAATKVDKQDFDYSTNAPLAVRNERYKLIHFFNSTGHPPYQHTLLSFQRTLTTPHQHALSTRPFTTS